MLVARWPRSPVRDVGLVLLAILVGALIYVHATNGTIFAAYVPGGNTAAWLDRWFDKSALPYPRLIACVIIFSFLWALVTRCWYPLQRWLGWLLLPLGQAALYAYAAHLFVIIAIQLLIVQVWGRGREVGINPGVDALIQIVGILAVWGLTRVRFLQGVTAPLGAPPLATFTLPRVRRVVPRPSDSLAAIGLAVLLCLPFLIPGGIGGTGLRSGGVVAVVPGAPAGAAPARSSRWEPGRAAEKWVESRLDRDRAPQCRRECARLLRLYRAQ